MEEGSSTATLLVRHLPEAIPFDTLSRLFSHYGASSVRPCTRGRVRNCAFVDFSNESLASQAHRQLNGLRFLGKVLSVEKASKSGENIKDQQEKVPKVNHLSPMINTPSARGHCQVPILPSFPASEPIADRLGVDYPFPPHLEYAYPPPDGNILTNIVNALIAVPRFYTQVLHLMNKMNIPAPFRMALPTPPLPPTEPAPLPPPPPLLPLELASKPPMADLSSDESEMEYSDEEIDDKSGSLKMKEGIVPRSKRKRETIVGPAFDKGVAHESVGLKSSVLVPKEMPIIKKKNLVLQIKIGSSKQTQYQQMEVDGNKEPSEHEKTNVDIQPYATPEILAKGRLPPEEILSLPMFKNYAAGNPAPVLYVKNLAKDVVADDFFYLFGSLFGSIDAAKSDLIIKLMQEGRMRGQAFVTFPSIELAHRALNLVNGYMLKNKSIIIQFGRSSTNTKSSESS
ncbi:U11/U12 small nuclear ribonucleoprotein 65 kDa protein-like [Impatiens glandulifera]|uniref:U11/U12 small nuclear ribonucleoprotein 65 kDa protein-like n=1 Tax=Impatiens glandulifera TaxID=253017 RepID=UPI001FB08672|nr:U11/U12 small nuclear ribonucleoprotein 65 kDa protein-like [Impatiens glandulifera]